MVLIYTHKITKRIQYIFKFYFGQLLGLEFKFTSDIEFFKASQGIKISYARKPIIGNEIFFNCAGLLFETGVEGQELGFFKYDGQTVFYPVYDKSSALPYDMFAAAFFLLTRYEEYLPYMRDKFGRFDAKESVSFKQGFLHLPVVNLWAEKLKKIIKERYKNVQFVERKFNFTPTIDIDSAYSYRLKGTVRTAGGFLKALMKFDFKEILERFQVITGLIKDPFDTYDLQLRLQKQYDLRPIYFILLGDYGKFDKNIPASSRQFQTLIKSLADYAEVGIHPSFDSNRNNEKLKVEIERLSKILNREITRSRQHFLMLNFPHSYRNLINLDITDDYTMGYASEPGFRAGTCDSYFFYDLDLETATKLKIHPFTVMEGTYKDYLYLGAEESLTRIKKLIDQVKAVDGTFISLWHNESLSNSKRWIGWQKVYEEMIKYALAEGRNV